MAQFDVFLNINSQTKKYIPYLLDIQADLLSDLATRIVVPLADSKQFDKTMKYLHPHFIIENKQVVMITTEMAGVPTKILGNKIVSLTNYRQDIINALDFIFTGV
jgi:toxin CcdB